MLACDNTPYEKIGNNEPVNIADEVPFKIPDSWEWTRFGQVIVLLSGTDFRPDEYNDKMKGIPYITGASSLSLDGVIVNRWTESPRVIANRGDVLLVCKGSGYGKTVICDIEEAHIARQIMAIKEQSLLDMQYVRLFLQANCDQIKAKGQGVIPGIDRDSVMNLLFPLPPLNEQHKIANRIAEVENLLSSYDLMEHKLSSLQNSFPEQLKKSILQMAVQGKLVPQNPTDEPASMLLERIRAEKHRLIKEGKIKKDKHESVIFRRDNSHYEKCGFEEVCIDEEIPFDIPDSWAWCRLRTVLQQASTGPFGSMLHKDDYTSEGVPIINPADIKAGRISSAKIKKVSIVTAQRLSSYMLHFGDVIIGRRGEMGRSASIEMQQEGWLCGTGCFYVTPISVLSSDYLVFFLKSPYAKALLTENSVGTTMNNLNHSILGNLLIPLPPIAEQGKIISQYDTIIALMES